MNWQVAVTDLGDFLCVSAAAVVVALWCWFRISALAGAGFLLAYSAMIAAVLGLKLVAAGVLPQPAEAGLLQLSAGAPSGHTALCVFVYGVAVALFLRSSSRGAKLAVLPCIAVIAGVAATRVTLHTHSAADVIAGLVIGAAWMMVPAAIVWSQTTASRPPTRGLLSTLGIVAVLMLMSGLRMSSTDLIA